MKMLPIISLCLRFVPLLLAIIAVYEIRRVESKLDTINEQLFQIKQTLKNKDK